ncbi:MAG TPA: hypothetical protein PK961_07625 [bacterium]|nr:hypothetical protein [bacterium]
MSERNHRRLFRLTLLLLGVLCGLAVGELLLRVVQPTDLVYRFPTYVPVDTTRPLPNPTNDPLLGPALTRTAQQQCYELAPNLDGRLRSSEFDVAFSTNELGMRNPPPGPKRGVRVLGLGNSFAMGFGVEEDETLFHTFARAWGRMDVEVLNGGVMGYTAHNSLAWLESKGLALAPDVAILQVWFPNGLLQDPQPKCLAPKTPPTARETLRRLALKSDLVSLGMNLLRRVDFIRRILLDKKILGRYEVEYLFRDDLTQTHAAAVSAAGTLLTRFKELADAHGFLPVVFVTPMREQLDPEQWRRIVKYNFMDAPPGQMQMDRPDRLLEKLAGDAGVAFVDPYIQDETWCRDEACYFTGYDVHLTPLGHERAGRFLYRQIAPLLEKSFE